MLNPSSFSLLHDILLDTRALHLNHFSSPEDDLTPLDQGIRSHMEDSLTLYERIRQITFSLSFGKIILLRDELRLTTVLFRSDPDSSAFYSIGPFRSLPYEEQDYIEIQKLSKLTLTENERLKLLLRPVPCNILRAEVIAIAKNILLAECGFKEPVAEEIRIKIEEANPPKMLPAEDINHRVRSAELTYQHEEKLLAFIAQGNEIRAIEEAQYFLHSNMNERIQPRLISHRSLLYSTNTLFRKAAQTVGIHPLRLDEISYQFASKLALCTSHHQLNDIYLEMIHEYCKLCRDYSTRNYSVNVRKAIHYIQLNLSADLSPAIIADAVNFSASQISHQFKEEVGMSLMNYISEERVKVARQLLENSSMTVREIASYVGIPDWNYFTKVFKKTVGCTPSEYRQKPCYGEQ